MLSEAGNLKRGGLKFSIGYSERTNAVLNQNYSPMVLKDGDSAKVAWNMLKVIKLD